MRAARSWVSEVTSDELVDTWSARPSLVSWSRVSVSFAAGMRSTSVALPASPFVGAYSVRPSMRPPAPSTMATAAREAAMGSSAVIVTLPVTTTSRLAVATEPPPPAESWEVTPCGAGATADPAEPPEPADPAEVPDTAEQPASDSAPSRARDARRVRLMMVTLERNRPRRYTTFITIRASVLCAPWALSGNRVRSATPPARGV